MSRPETEREFVTDTGTVNSLLDRVERYHQLLAALEALVREMDSREHFADPAGWYAPRLAAELAKHREGQ